jgi:hypothetical protein
MQQDSGKKSPLHEARWIARHLYSLVKKNQLNVQELDPELGRYLWPDGDKEKARWLTHSDSNR